MDTEPSWRVFITVEPRALSWKKVVPPLPYYAKYMLPRGTLSPSHVPPEGFTEPTPARAMIRAGGQMMQMIEAVIVL